jgi:hypothetical protein
MKSRGELFAQCSWLFPFQLGRSSREKCSASVFWILALLLSWWRRSIDYVDRIRKGTKPADLPVQQAMRFEFIINLKAAEKIGHKIPYELLWRANRVIK